MIRGSQFIRKKAFAGHNLQEKLKNKLNLLKGKTLNLSVFNMFTGSTNASGGPQSGRVFETPALNID
jgi:hypothetical protein